MSFVHTQIELQYSRIENNTLIFIPIFNDPLTLYNKYELILKYPSLRFEEYRDHISLFNHPIFLTCNLQEVYMGRCFNNTIVLNPGLRKLTLGYNFNKPITLTYNLTHIIFGNCFDQPIILTPNVQHLTLDSSSYDYPIILNKTMIELVLGCCKNSQCLTVLSKNLKHVTYYSYCGTHIILPKTIVHVDLTNMFNPVMKFTKKIQCAKLDVRLRNIFSSIVLINKNAFKISLGPKYSCYQIPKSSKYLKIAYNNTIVLAKNLNLLCLLGVMHKDNPIVEHSVTKICVVCDKLNYLIDNLPNSIENIKIMIHIQTFWSCHYDYLQTDNPPSSLKKNQNAMDHFDMQFITNS